METMKDNLESLNKLLDMNIGVLLYGKTSKCIDLVCNYAESHKQEMTMIQGGIRDRINDLLGFTTMDGKYVASPLTDAAENGKILLITDVEESNQNLLTELHYVLDFRTYKKGLVIRDKYEPLRLDPTIRVCDQNYLVGMSKPMPVNKNFKMIFASKISEIPDKNLSDRLYVLKV